MFSTSKFFRGSSASGFIALAHFSGSFVVVYPFSSGFGVRVANPATLPTGTGNDVAFNPTGTAIAMAQGGYPYVSAYPWAAGFGTKYSDPTTVPPDQANSVTFSP
jgi:hypothetical protein